MMSQAFYTGVSGLKNYSSGIDVVSNNIANISTTGFRAYNAEYAPLFEDALASASSSVIGVDSVGAGVRMQATSMSEAQGSLLQTDRSSDLAILGDGWFGVQSGEETIYTRDGAFSIDANADLVTGDGYYVLGTMGGNISDDGLLTQKLASVPLGDVNAQQKLRFPDNLRYPPEATTQIKLIANVGVGSEPVVVGGNVIDAEGNRNYLRLEFLRNETQTPPGSQYTVTAQVIGSDGETVYDTQSGEVTFDETGALSSTTLTTINNNGSVVQIDLGGGYDGIVSQDTPYVPGSSISDGTIAGDLVGYSVNRDGEVVATFTNGEQSSVGKVAVYHFGNNQGLDRLSGTKFAQSSNSGAPYFVQDAEGNNVLGTAITNYRLENSNYDMSVGLTELIILQRSYDANSKTVTTADQMIQKALNMDA